MNYIENVYICLAAPMLVALICMQSSRKRLILFLLIGMTSCLLSSYISTFLTLIAGETPQLAAIEIVPMVEETVKLLPILFYLMVFEPKKELATTAAVLIGIGFATFENVCYLTQSGAEEIFRLMIRGFGTGAMHVICGVIAGTGVLYMWDRFWLRAVGTVGLWVMAVVYHAVYNLLVSQTGLSAWAGYLIPLITTMMILIYGKKIYNRGLLGSKEES